MDEKTACFVITSAESIGGVTVDRMRDFAGSLVECLETDPRIFLDAGILNRAQLREFTAVLGRREQIIGEYSKLALAGVRTYIKGEEGYPKRLMFLKDAPAILFVKGSLPSESMRTAAIVGARAASEYGIQATEFFAGELSRAGVQIVSGLAYGIDAAAARGALGSGGKSFAVLGSGIDICYPPENFELYEAMCEPERGGVITEFHPGRKPLGVHFVMRNRIIAGLGDVLLVMEARLKSGTVITVDYALNQGKEVFAMPGRINDELGRGCNRLLKEGAQPLTEPQDVLAALGKDVSAADEIMNRKKDTSLLTAKELKVYEVLGEDSLHVEDIAQASGLEIKFVITLLYALELKGYAVNTGSAYYRRC